MKKAKVMIELDEKEIDELAQWGQKKALCVSLGIDIMSPADRLASRVLFAQPKGFVEVGHE